MSLYNENIKALAASLVSSPPLSSFSKVVSGDSQTNTINVSVDNPLCGDRIRLEAVCQQGEIGCLHAEVRGCLLCQAATAIALAAIQEAPLSVDELCQVTSQWQDFLQSTNDSDWSQLYQQAVLKHNAWQQLALFAPLQAHKSRQPCVRLVFDALKAVFQQAELTKAALE